MENAVRALYIAAGVLIGIMILSLAVVIFSNLQSYVETSNEEIRFNEITRFNAKFTKYINYTEGKKQFDLTIQDIVTVASVAYESNNSYNPDSTKWGEPDPNSLYIAVNLDRNRIDKNIKDNMINLLQDNSEKKFRCDETSITYSDKTGRIIVINFRTETE